MRTTILAVLLALVSLAGFAQAPDDAPLVASPLDSALFAAHAGSVEKATCGATAACGTSPSVSCTANGKNPSCSAVDQDCAAGQRGYAKCGSTKIDCPACPPTTLPPCETYCSCAVPCFTTACDGGGGLVQDCSEWGICATSCYCGGECLQGGNPQALFQSKGACPAPTSADALLSRIFG